MLTATQKLEIHFLDARYRVANNGPLDQLENASDAFGQLLAYINPLGIDVLEAEAIGWSLYDDAVYQNVLNQAIEEGYKPSWRN